MRGRTEDILKATIEGFIKIGEPISSSWLYDQYDFGIKPAMIRHELEELTQEGFLEQPYHSSGRVPSNYGYEFFAEKIISSTPEIVSFEFSTSQTIWPNIASWISEELRTLGVLIRPQEQTTYKIGLEKLIDGLSWDSPTEIKEVIKDFEEIDNRIRGAYELIDDTIKVFIGKKSPITKSKNLAVVLRGCASSYGPTIIMAIGPKRMDYKKAVKTLTNIKSMKNGRRN